MNLGRMLKIAGIVILVAMVGFLQLTFSIFEINGVSPSLMLIVVFTISFFGRKGSKPRWVGFLTAAGGGLLLDVFSGLPLGVEALMLIGVVLLVEQTLKFLDKANFLIYFVLFLVVLVVYQVTLNFFSFGIFVFGWTGLIYNLSLATLVYLSCFLVNVLKEK